MAGLIKENVGKGRIFHGLKLYAPNGYSPTDLRLFDDGEGFIDGKSLYSFCITEKIPILAHCSCAGFATFADKLEVCGDIYRDGKIFHYDKPAEILFHSNILDGYGKSVRERAGVLNHPVLWRLVMERYPGLKICLAHFGGDSGEWRESIAGLMNDFDSVYTDLSCIADYRILKAIKEEYFDRKNPITARIMYGSDFYLNMLKAEDFRDYYDNFRALFSPADLERMNLAIPEKFLGL
jgi:hypothetical protein